MARRATRTLMMVADQAVYATQPKPLSTQITNLLKQADPDPIEGDILALIVPDSNQLRGGAVAAEAFATLKGRSYDTVILITPSHTGSFRRITICSVDDYHTPLGEVKVNDLVRNELCDEDDDIFLDDTGHYHVEGVDVQLPFLQTLLGAFDIVPIVMGDESPDFCRELGRAVGEVMYSRQALIVATADVLEASEEAMEAFTTHLENMDESRLMALLNSDRIQIEGHGAILVALIAAMHRRANRARVLRTQAPGKQASGKDEIGFAGAVLWRE